MRWTALAALVIAPLAWAACRAEPSANPAAQPPSPALPEPSGPRSSVAAARVELQSARIIEVLAMLEALSGEPVIVDPEAEPIVRCGVINVHPGAELSNQAAIRAIEGELEASGLIVIDTKKGIVLQRRAGSIAPVCR